MVVVGGSGYACQDVATGVLYWVCYILDLNVLDGPAVVACGPGRYVGSCCRSRGELHVDDSVGL